MHIASICSGIACQHLRQLSSYASSKGTCSRSDISWVLPWILPQAVGVSMSCPCQHSTVSIVRQLADAVRSKTVLRLATINKRAPRVLQLHTPLGLCLLTTHTQDIGARLERDTSPKLLSLGAQWMSGKIARTTRPLVSAARCICSAWQYLPYDQNFDESQKCLVESNNGLTVKTTDKDSSASSPHYQVESTIPDSRFKGSVTAVKRKSICCCGRLCVR